MPGTGGRAPTPHQDTRKPIDKHLWQEVIPGLAVLRLKRAELHGTSFETALSHHASSTPTSGRTAPFPAPAHAVEWWGRV